MAGGLTAEWLAARFAGAPTELVQRASEFVGEIGTPSATPEALSQAARRALAAALARTADRGAALDLLAADALVTVALAAQVEADPAGLERFARELRDRDATAL